jgi:hypothetical protein
MLQNRCRASQRKLNVGCVDVVLCEFCVESNLSKHTRKFKGEVFLSLLVSLYTPFTKLIK